MPTGADNTSNAREFVFGDAPSDLEAAERLQSSWSSFTRGAMGAISPECTVYVFDDASIEPIWDWYVSTYADRSAPAPTEEPAPEGAPGEDGRLFVFPASFDRESWSYAFRQGNVIAVVSIDAEAGAGSSAEDLVPIAQAVVRRIEAAAAGEPLPAAPSPTPEPSFPTAAEADLIEHVPASFRDSCARSSFAQNEESLAAVGCVVPMGIGSATVTFQQLPDQAALQQLYENTLSFMGVTADSGPCGGEWPAEGTYTIGGEPAGRVGCALLGEIAAIISWTDERLLIHGYAEGFGVDRQQLYDWWLQDSGPIGAPEGDPSRACRPARSSPRAARSQDGGRTRRSKAATRAPPSATGSSPRCSASQAVVTATWRGSLRRPRIPRGLRNGESVSVSSRSGGTSRATSALASSPPRNTSPLKLIARPIARAVSA